MKGQFKDGWRDGVVKAVWKSGALYEGFMKKGDSIISYSELAATLITIYDDE